MRDCGGLVSEKTVMHLRQIAKFGSYARFFFELIAMFLIVSGLAFCLIAVAYAEERPLNTPVTSFHPEELANSNPALKPRCFMVLEAVGP